MSLQQCQEETTSTQFLDWMEYLDRDVNAFHREDHFLANIAAEIRRSFVREPEKVKVKSFLLKFVTERRATEPVVKPMTVKEAAEKSKRRWLSWARIKRKG